MEKVLIHEKQNEAGVFVAVGVREGVHVQIKV